MPPKKDDKKGKKGAVILKEVDSTEYVRSPVEIESSFESETKSPPLSGKIANVETLFPEWQDIDSELWSQPIAAEHSVEVVYPKNLCVTSKTTISSFFSLNLDPPVDPKAKAPKKENKKGQKDVEPELEEKFTDYSGNPMPVIFKGTGDESSDQYMGFEYPRPFYKYFNDKSGDVGVDTNPAAPVLEHAPAGIEIDCYICCALRSVKRFAPAIIASQGDEDFRNNYLWRAIYPKLKSGKPCYNPSGKYCVRLYLAGKWRKIYVDDTIPLREDGRPALASSSDRLELWPLLLAKAIYTIYSACGYSTLIDDVDNSVKIATKDLMKLIKSNQVTIPHKICSFVSFVVHLLTGWQPTSPMSVTSVFLNEKTRSIKLLLSITAAGVIEIDADDYIDDVSDGIDFQILQIGDITGSFCASTENDEGLILKTKKRFQEEYRVRKERRDAMLESIAIRESKINKIQAAMNLSLSEVFLVVVFDRQFNKWRVLPIMAICYPKVGSGSLNNVKILVDWKIGSPVSDPNSSPAKPKLSRPDEFPLPPITPLKCEWTTIDELMKGNAYIVAMDTLIKTPFNASLSRHWMPEKPLVPTDASVTNARSKSPNKDMKRGGKDAKTVAEPVSPKDIVCVDPGLPPVTLLRLDISSFYHMVAVDGDGHELDDQQVTDSANFYGASRHSFDADANAAEAIEEQLKELSRYNENDQQDTGPKLGESSSSSSLDVSPVLALKPKKGYLSLSLMIHGDMTTSPHTYDDVNPVNPTKKKDPTQKNVLPGDVVIILQEIRLDNIEPMMFVMDMKQNSYIPLGQKTFMIPQNKLPENPITSGPLIFWVRVFTKSSVYIHFSSSVAVTLGDAEKIWVSDLNRQVFIKEGDAGITQPNTEQLLFRCPLQKMPVAPPSGEVVIVDDKDSTKSSTPEYCVSFVYIADRDRARNIALKCMTNLPVSNPPHAQLVSEQGEKHELHSSDNESGEMISLVCTVEPPQLATVSTALTSTMGNMFYGKTPSSLPAFHWKLLVLSASPIVEPIKPINEQPVTQRYSGKYVANNKLALFRDVYTIEKASFPIAMKLVLQPLEAETGTESDTPIANSLPKISDISISLKFYRKRDNLLISEHKGKGEVHCYSQAIGPFIEGEPDRPLTATKKDTKPPAKGAKVAPPETTDIIVECTLDESAMLLPDILQSRYPHYFDAIVTAANKDSIRPLFLWQLDLLSGKVASVSHDISNLQRYAAVKNQWEESSTGREERAIAAYAYSKERHKKDLLPPDDEERTVLTNEMVDALMTALSTSNTNVEDIRQRYGLIHKLPVYQENIEVLLNTLQDMDKQDKQQEEKDFAEYLNTVPAHVMNSPTGGDGDSVGSLGSANSSMIVGELFTKYKEDHVDSNVKQYQDMLKRLDEYGQLLRDTAKSKIEASIAESDENARELAKIWPLRENYRLDVEKKNAALSSLLKRAKDAIQIIKDIENPPVDVKGKKKK